MGTISEDGIYWRGQKSRPRVVDAEHVEEPARSIPVFCECDVLVVGGGPSGTAAAVSAARAGAKVALLERHNHLGGLSTGGLVIWIDRMTDWTGSLVIRGFASELLTRLGTDALAGPEPEAWGKRDRDLVTYWQERSSAHHGIVTWAPTLDPEQLKLASQELALESGVRLVMHAWGAAPMMRDGCVTGVFFESKSGRAAIRAHTVIDCTGDGDIFHRAGASSESDIDERDIHHCMNDSWLFGGVDMDAWLAFRRTSPEGYAAFMRSGRESCGGLFERPVVSWRQDVALFMGPRLGGYSGTDVEDLTEADIRSRRLMYAHLRHYQQNAPGFGKAFVMLSAPQLGVRHTRRLLGIARMRRGDWSSGARQSDEVGISPSIAPQFPNVSVPYGSLLPRDVGGLLVAGRHISCDPGSHSFMREIPQCWLTGQAAGAAAALAAANRCQPHDVSIAALQRLLRHQNVHLSIQDTNDAGAHS